MGYFVLYVAFSWMIFDFNMSSTITFPSESIPPTINIGNEEEYFERPKQEVLANSSNHPIYRKRKSIKN